MSSTLQKYKDHNTGKYYSQAQLDAWATQLTGIKANKGTNKDRKAGRSKGRYIKGKI